VGEVEARGPNSAIVRNAEQANSNERQEPSLPDRPSVAVLPFQNLSGDPEQEYFADGVVEDIILALSRIRWLSLSLGIRASHTRAGPWMSDRWGAS
jgi:TolB-like protein